MKRSVWGGGVFIPLCLAMVLSWPQVRGTLAVLARGWWVFPLFASLASLIALEVSLFFVSFERGRRSTVPTLAYLVSGPSVAVFNLSALFPQAIPPPSWAGALMLALLLGSAWAYYLSSREKGDEPGSRPGTHPPFKLTSP